MDDLTDFNNIGHRISSATATFQKGIYHLYFLNNQNSQELFAKILRTYQCLFQLCITHLLLDFNYRFDSKDIQSRLRKRCKDPNLPTRNEIDPAAIITHSIFENKKWKGVTSSHPLFESAKNSLELFSRTVNARHNLIYRPFMLYRYWEDCTLINLLENVPSAENVEIAYKKFLGDMLVWAQIEKRDFQKNLEITFKSLEGATQEPVTPICSGTFLYDLFMPYKDKFGKRPTESLLLSYARILNTGDENLLDSIASYRNTLIESQKMMEFVHLQSDWRTPEFFLQ